VPRLLGVLCQTNTGFIGDVEKNMNRIGKKDNPVPIRSPLAAGFALFRAPAAFATVLYKFFAPSLILKKIPPCGIIS
jgi:hypothetical protein